MSTRIRSCRRLLCMSIILVFAFTLTGCDKVKKKTYENYVKSLIGINYLGATDDYIKATGANKEDADALYNANMELLADNILTYYGIEISDAPELKEEFIELSKHIYSKVNYTVGNVHKGTSCYYVDVTIYPMNLFIQSYDNVKAYIDTFNTGVTNGLYNDYTLSEYETIFSRGMIDILFEASLVMEYADPVTITVEIVEEGNTYHILDSDFIKIHNAMFNFE